GNDIIFGLLLLLFLFFILVCFCDFSPAFKGSRLPAQLRPSISLSALRSTPLPPVHTTASGRRRRLPRSKPL
ncbi:hypothetical protein L1887_24961, partial [Cichorium endivia]